jgi:hypothetical protein
MNGIGVLPLYKQSQWNRWQKLCGDMSSSFEVWFEHHRQMLENFKVKGITVHAVEVDIDAYIVWIAAGKLPINGETRNQFAIHTFKTIGDDHSNN